MDKSLLDTCRNDAKALGVLFGAWPLEKGGVAGSSCLHFPNPSSSSTLYSLHSRQVQQVQQLPFWWRAQDKGALTERKHSDFLPMAEGWQGHFLSHHLLRQCRCCCHYSSCWRGSNRAVGKCALSDLLFPLHCRNGNALWQADTCSITAGWTEHLFRVMLQGFRRVWLTGSSL